MNGLDSDGNDLLVAMPRFKLSVADMAHLIAYVKRLESDLDPGLTDNSVRIGLVLPSTGSLADLGAAMKDVFNAYFEDVNNKGGIFNRKIELHFADAGAGGPRNCRRRPNLSDKRTNLRLCRRPERRRRRAKSQHSRAAKKSLSSVLLRRCRTRRRQLTGTFSTCFPASPNNLPPSSTSRLPARSCATRSSRLFTQTIRSASSPPPPRKNMQRRSAAHSKRNSVSRRRVLTPAQMVQDLKALWCRSAAVLRHRQRTVVVTQRSRPPPDGNQTCSCWEQWRARNLLQSPETKDKNLHRLSDVARRISLKTAVNEFRALHEKYKFAPRHTASQLSAFATAKIFVEALTRAGKV